MTGLYLPLLVTGLREASALALPASSPSPPPSGIGGAPVSPATWSEPQVAFIGTFLLRR